LIAGRRCLAAAAMMASRCTLNRLDELLPWNWQPIHGNA
jgi:hypothetical protein